MGGGWVGRGWWRGRGMWNGDVSVVVLGMPVLVGG